MEDQKIRQSVVRELAATGVELIDLPAPDEQYAVLYKIIVSIRGRGCGNPIGGEELLGGEIRIRAAIAILTSDQGSFVFVMTHHGAQLLDAELVQTNNSCVSTICGRHQVASFISAVHFCCDPRTMVPI